MLKQELIENALALTGRTMEDMMEWMYYDNCGHNKEFSIEKFGWYLLSAEFIEKYQKLQIVKWCIHYYIGEFGKAIYEYQLFMKPNKTYSEWGAGSEAPLTNLLSKL